jgi:hypothetical protein
MPQRDHETVPHNSHKYMSFHPMFKLMMYRTHGQVAL